MSDAEIHRIIGTLQGGFEAMLRELASLKESVNNIQNNMHALPPSPACIDKHEEFNEFMANTRAVQAKQVGFIGGLALFGSVFVNWILDKFHLVFGGAP